MFDIKRFSVVIDDIRFEYKCIKFRKLFFRVQSLLLRENLFSLKSIKLLIDLDTKRSGIQSEVADLLAGYSAQCAVCRGGCCRGNKEYFRSIDYWTRRFGHKPLNSYKEEREVRIRLKRLIHWLLSISESLRKKDEYGKRATDNDKTTTCKYLTSTGCGLSAGDRPIYCIVWACSALRRSLEKKDYELYLDFLNQLFEVSREVEKVLKSEARNKNSAEKNNYRYR